MPCGPGGCGNGLGPVNGAYGAGVANAGAFGAPFEVSQGVYPQATAIAQAQTGYFSPGGYGYVFGYGSGHGSIHDGFRRQCCFPYYFPNSQSLGCRPGTPAVSYGGWW